MWARSRGLRARLEGAIVAVAILATCGSGQLHDQLFDPDHVRTVYDVRVLEVDAGSVALERTDESVAPGLWGLQWRDGYGRVGAVVVSTEDAVTRTFEPVSGGDLEAGIDARIDPWVYRRDPARDLGLSFTEVDVPSRLGPLPSWLVPGSGDGWAILVHGRGASRCEALRLVPALHHAGYSSLVISYRNDEGAPASPDGLFHLGETEWEDLESAVDYSLDRGAGDVVLVGFSMGGAIVSQFLRRSVLASEVSAAILDAPALDWSATVDRVGERVGIPPLVTATMKASSAVRYDIDWDELRELSHVDELHTPILLFHGVEDATVPVEVSDALARARPDLVTYVRVAGAGHVGSWNVDAESYEAHMVAFLEGVHA